MRVHKIETMQTADTTMLTDNIFFSGCSIGCDFCFNKNLWLKEKGKEMTPMEIICLLSDIKWVALMGGEPMEQDPQELHSLIMLLKNCGKNIVMFTGYSHPFIFDVDHYHIDVKIESTCTMASSYWTPKHLEHRISYGVVTKDYDEMRFKMKFSDINPNSPIYIKSHIPPLTVDYSEIMKRWLNEIGFYYVYIDKKINV